MNGNTSVLEDEMFWKEESVALYIADVVADCLLKAGLTWRSSILKNHRVQAMQCTRVSLAWPDTCHASLLSRLPCRSMQTHGSPRTRQA